MENKREEIWNETYIDRVIKDLHQLVRIRGHMEGEMRYRFLNVLKGLGEGGKLYEANKIVCKPPLPDTEIIKIKESILAKRPIKITKIINDLTITNEEQDMLKTIKTKDYYNKNIELGRVYVNINGVVEKCRRYIRDSYIKTSSRQLMDISERVGIHIRYARMIQTQKEGVKHKQYVEWVGELDKYIECLRKKIEIDAIGDLDLKRNILLNYAEDLKEILDKDIKNRGRFRVRVLEKQIQNIPIVLNRVSKELDGMYFGRLRRVKTMGGNKLKTQENFVEEVRNLVGDEYTVESEYEGADKKVLMRHNTCGTRYEVVASQFLWGNRCVKCRRNKSRGEDRITQYLNDNNIEFECEKTFEGLEVKRKLRYDFAIYVESELIGLVEYDGLQHYEPIDIFGGEEQFLITQQYDKIKNSYAEDNNIPLLRINYAEDDIIEEKLTKWLGERCINLTKGYLQSK